MVTAAAVQMVSGPEVDANLREAGRLVREAAEAGARLVVLPENFAIMGRDDRDKLAVTEPEGDGPMQTFLAELAGEAGVWIVGGTIPLAGPTPDRAMPACLVYDARGRRVARFDKLHLFDVNIAASGEAYRESATWMPGDGMVAVEGTPVGCLGLAVCYDLRFPELFRALVDRGAVAFALPAAFTAATGRAHWEALIRARAIENQCYVIASAQGGRHASGRETFGDSMIVDPWGEVLARQASGPGIVMADIDSGRVRDIRQRFPSLAHRRL